MEQPTKRSGSGFFNGLFQKQTWQGLELEGHLVHPTRSFEQSLRNSHTVLKSLGTTFLSHACTPCNYAQLFVIISLMKSQGSVYRSMSDLFSLLDQSKVKEVKGAGPCASPTRLVTSIVPVYCINISETVTAIAVWPKSLVVYSTKIHMCKFWWKIPNNRWVKRTWNKHDL